MRFLLPLLLLIFLPCTGARAQSAPLPTGDENYDFARRMLVRYGTDGFAAPATDLSLQPTGRAQLVRLMRLYYGEHYGALSRTDLYRFEQFFADNDEWLALPPLDTSDGDRAAFDLGTDFALLSEQSPQYATRRPLLKYFYRTPANLLSYNRKDFYLRLNPVVDFRYGKQRDDAEDYFYNRRGLRLRAGIDDRIFMHFEIHETQAGLPDYVRQLRAGNGGGLPGAGFVKNYTLDVANVANGADFLNGQGYVSADLTRHVGARLGYGNHFVGDGQRSMLLSDFSNNYPFLELNWRIWKFHYRNIFAELTSGPQGRPGPGIPLPKKYLAAHHLSINLGKRLTVGLFEAVVLNRENGFDLAYLNPVMFYRTIEQSVGSPDNALIGFTGRYRAPWRMEFYGQFILDEFVFDELFVERRGWWANKWAYQAGLRYVDALGLDQLDLFAEHNVARPYSYTHRAEANYTHFAFPLAHPLGANFRETVVGLDYRPLPRLHLRGRYYRIAQGRSTGAEDVVGADLNVSNLLRTADFGNEIGQGNQHDINLLTLRGGYELWPNLWVEGEVLLRDEEDELSTPNRETTVINFGVRWNVSRREWNF